MGRARGKGGKFEEEQVGPLAELKAALAWDDERGREKAELEALAEAHRSIQRPSLKPAVAGVMLPSKRKVGVTLSLSLATVDNLERLAFDAGVKRGDYLESLLREAVEKRWGKSKKGE